MFHGTRRHVRVPIRPQRPPAAAGKASLPPSRPPPRPPPRVTRALKETNNNISFFSFSFSFSDDGPRPYRRRASVTDPQLLLQHLVTHSSSTTSRLRAGTVGNRDTTTTINTNSSLTAEMPLTTLHSTRRFRGTLGAGARDSSRVGGGTRGSNSRSCSATLARFCPRAVGTPYRTRSSPSTLFASTSSMW